MRRSRVPVSSDAHAPWLSSSRSNAATIGPVSRISEMARARRRLRSPACSGHHVPNGTPRCRSEAAARLRPRSAGPLPHQSRAPTHHGRAEGLPRRARAPLAALAQAVRPRSRRWLFRWSPCRHGSGASSSPRPVRRSAGGTDARQAVRGRRAASPCRPIRRPVAMTRSRHGGVPDRSGLSSPSR